MKLSMLRIVLDGGSGRFLKPALVTEPFSLLFVYYQPVKGIDDLKNIATIASGSVEMGRIIAQAFEKVGEKLSLFINVHFL